MRCLDGVTGGEDLLLPVEHDGGGQVDGHQREAGQEKVVMPDHVRIIRQDMTKPSDQTGQGEDGANLCLQVRVEGGVEQPDDGVHQLQMNLKVYKVISNIIH